MTFELSRWTRSKASVLILAGALGCATADNPHMEKVDLNGDHSPVISTRVVVDPGMPRVEQARDIYLGALEVFNDRKYEQAYLEFSRVLDVEPHFYEARFKQGLCRYYQQKFDLEIDSYEKCLAIEPNYLPCLVSLGNAYLAQDELEKAVRVYRKILKLDPDHPVALYNLGLICFDLQDYHMSAEYLEHFIRSCPNDPYRPRAQILLDRVRAKFR
ncbi:MAG TPA: tetratricopeptide repeat protein [Planctomycetota bacterium]|nr:tetratricopeptide repeat protein [Planctomycetota bacterium]